LQFKLSTDIGINTQNLGEIKIYRNSPFAEIPANTPITQAQESADYYAVYKDSDGKEHKSATLTIRTYADTIYVSEDGDDLADGYSWNTAKRNLAAALNVSKDGAQIWISKGIYDIESTLCIPRNTTIRGGFGGKCNKLFFYKRQR